MNRVVADVAVSDQIIGGIRAARDVVDYMMGFQMARVIEVPKLSIPSTILTFVLVAH